MVIRICKSKEKEEFEDTKMVIRICKSKEKEEFEDTKMVIRMCKSKEKEELDSDYHCCFFFWLLCSLL
jgi:hypothetical protein